MPYSEQRLTLSQRLNRLQENVGIAQERRELNKQVWEDTYSFYQSDPPTSYDPEGYRLQVNYPWAWYESMMPSLVYRNPVFTAIPQSQESEEELFSSAITMRRLSRPLLEEINQALLLL